MMLEGKVDAGVVLHYAPGQGMDLEARVINTGGVVKVDKATVRTLVVDLERWAGGASLLGSKGGRILDRRYATDDMIPFEEFEVVSRQMGPRIETQITMRNEYLDIVVETAITQDVVAEFLRMKQSGTLGAAGL